MQFTKPKTLDTITAQFTKVVTDLNALIDKNYAEQARLTAEIEEKRAQVVAVREENERATKIKGNIEKLIG